MSSFGAWLRERRRAASLTQGELGTLVGCATGTIRHLEAGRQRPSEHLMRRLALHFGVRPEDVAGFVSAACDGLPPAQSSLPAPVLPLPAPAPVRVEPPAGSGPTQQGPDTHSLAFELWLRRCRGALGLTQGELARRLGYAVPSYRKIEQGERAPSRAFIERLAGLLSLPAQEQESLLRFGRGRGQPPAITMAGVAASSLYAAPASPRATASASGLPLAPSALIGRVQELELLDELLSDDAGRLITIVGPPGVGKTRLSQELALRRSSALPDGACFIALAGLSDAALLPATISLALSLPQNGAGDQLDQLIAQLRQRQMLLVLDNLEQISEAGGLLAGLLARCPGLRLLVTSRVPLHVRAERLLPLAPLALPDLSRLPEPALLADVPAIALYLARARAVDPGFQLTPENAPALAQICARLDGLPLGIELIASRSAAFAPETILARLDRQLLLETGGIEDLPARQRTLRAAIEWSYQLLPDEPRRLFAQLGVFVGHWSIEAAEAICAVGQPGPDVFGGIATLLDMSLLQRAAQEQLGASSSTYLTMLGYIREYALNLLEESGELSALRDRHAAYFLALAEGAERQLSGGEQQRWLDRLEHEHGELRAALRWALDCEELELALRLGGALWRFWQIHGHQSEGRRWLRIILERVGATPASARLRVLYGAGWLAEGQGDTAQAQAYFTECVETAEQLGDRQGLAQALHGLGALARNRGDYALATELFERSLDSFLPEDGQEPLAWTWLHLGVLALQQGDHARARQRLDQSLSTFRELEQRWATALCLSYLGSVARDQGQLGQAEPLYQEACAIYGELGDQREHAVLLTRLGYLAQLRGALGRAEQCYRQSTPVFRALDDAPGLCVCLEGWGALAEARGDRPLAARLYHLAAQLVETRQVARWPDLHYAHQQLQQRLPALLSDTACAAAWHAVGLQSLDQTLDELL